MSVLLKNVRLSEVSTLGTDLGRVDKGGFLVHHNFHGLKMNKTSGTSEDAADKLVKNILRKTRQTYSAEEKIRIVLAGLRGEESISVLYRREVIAESLYYSWSKEFLEAGKRRL